MGRDCIRRAIEASKNAMGDATLSEKDAKQLFDELQARAAVELRAMTGTDINDAMDAVIKEMRKNISVAGAIQKQNAFININKEKELTTKVESFIAAGLSVRKAFQAMLVGINGVYNQGRSSVDNKFKSVYGRYLGALVKDLDKEKLTGIIHQRALQPEIERELYALSSGTQSGKTGSKEALKIAKIIYKYNESLRVRQNRGGARIDKLESYTTTQTHDRLEMRKQGYEKWRDTILPLLDQERTFKGANIDDFLRSSYEVLTTGVSRKEQQALGVRDGNISAFSKQQASLRVNDLSGISNPDVFVAEMAKLRSEVKDKNFDLAMKDLVKAGLPPQMKLMAMIKLLMFRNF